MKSVCLDKLPHSCGTRKGLQVFAREDGTVDGYCFSCKTVVSHPYGEETKVKDLPEPKVKTDEEIQEEINEISSYPSVDLPNKKLRGRTLAKFGVVVALSEEDGATPDFVCYPYSKEGKLVGYKIKRVKDKVIWSVGSLKGCDLFGWEQALKSGASRLIITEGEDDAMAWAFRP